MIDLGEKVGRKQNKINKAMQNLDKYITTNNTL